MRIEGLSVNKVGQFAVVLEVTCFYFCSIYYFLLENFVSVWLWIMFKIIFVSCQKVYEVAPCLYMVDVRKAAGDTLDYHKVSFCIYIYIYLHFPIARSVFSNHLLLKCVYLKTFVNTVSNAFCIYICMCLLINWQWRFFIFLCSFTRIFVPN